MTVPTLQTRRLLIRPFELDDLDHLAAILGDPETMRYYPSPYTREQSLGWIEDSIRRYASDGFGLFALELRETGEFVGDCGPALRVVEGVSDPELGWHVRRDLWGGGLATEAATACRDWMFDELHHDRLISLVRPVNVPSGRVAEKIGMRVERDVEYHGYLHHVYSMTPMDRRS